MTIFLQVALAQAAQRHVICLVAVGLSLIWGVSDVINFAHGEFLMIAMYVSYWLGFLLHRSFAFLDRFRSFCVSCWGAYL